MNEINQAAEPAGLFRRFAAFFYDCLLLTAVYFVIGAIAVGINSGESLPLVGSLFVSLVFFPMSAFLFYCWFWRRGGQTLGMQAWRLKLVGDTILLSLKSCSTRFLVSILSLMTLGIGFLWMLIDRKKRTWHDIASDTRVVAIARQK